MGGFGERIAAAVEARESQILVGLDPAPGRLWGAAGGSAADDVRRHCELVLDAVAPAVVGVKLQLACFERLGAAGWRSLTEAAEHARSLGLVVVADGKRADIDVSAAAYADALFEGEGGINADAATVAPYMGRDSLQPFVDKALERAAGVFVLVRTSNPGAQDIEELELAAGGAVWEAVARMVGELAGHGDGLASVGAVAGATAPAQLARVRELLPRSILLIPGVGAQGGAVEQLGPAFAPGRGGGLVTVSRSIVDQPGEDPAAARAAAERLREQAWTVSDI